MSIQRHLMSTVNVILSPLRGGSIESDDPDRTWHFDGSPELLHSRVHPEATYSPWLTDSEFLDAYALAAPNSLVDRYRMYELWSLARQIRGLEGDVLEVGVWRGGTGLLLSRAVRDSRKQVFLADTFSGVVKAGPRDTRYKGGEHADVSRADVEELMEFHECENVEILVGVFPEDTGNRILGKLALVHVDVDVFESARHVLNFAKPRMPVGGVVVFDDYGFYGCEGVTRLVNELSAEDGFVVVHNLNGHAVLVKVL